MKKILLCLHLLLLPLTTSLRAEVIEEQHPVVILGGGIAALTSAVYLSRAGIPPVVITGPVVGGTITQSHNVQNWPGEIGISGAALGDRVKQQAEANGVLLQSEVVVSVDFSKRPYLITTKKILGASEEVKRYKTQAVIIALGANPNLLHIPGETGSDGYWSRGVYSCAVCDGALYKDKVVAVVGGGDSALTEAQYLANIAAKVHLIVRKEKFRTVEKQRMQEILSLPNVEVHFKTEVKEVKGDGERVTHLVLKDNGAQKSWDLPTDALFLAIGSRPNTELFNNQLELDGSGYIVLQKHQETSCEGIYAVGDVADPEFKQAVSAAGDAAKAALQAQQFLASQAALTSQSGLQAQAKISAELKKVIEIRSREQFEKEVRESKVPVFVDFYSTYCGPCRMFSPIYEGWAHEYGGKAKFLKINAEEVQELFMQFQIRAVPTLVILDEKGNILRRSSGFKEIGEVDKHLNKIKSQVAFSPLDFK